MKMTYAIMQLCMHDNDCILNVFICRPYPCLVPFVDRFAFMIYHGSLGQVCDVYESAGAGVFLCAEWWKLFWIILSQSQ